MKVPLFFIWDHAGWYKQLNSVTCQLPLGIDIVDMFDVQPSLTAARSYSLLGGALHMAQSSADTTICAHARGSVLSS